MPINPDKLIAAAMLQDLLVDKDGTPMAAGTITCYHDNSRTTLKNWYYQTGSPVKYSYLPLPNPLTLSAAGTITDVNGVDTIPFFYPYLEADENTVDTYYITIVNFAQTNQITRQNFPFIPSQSTAPVTTTSLNNLIVNNGFWRNIAPNTVNNSPSFASVSLAAPFLTAKTVSIGSVSTLYTGIVAPSQHDGFSFSDIQFVKNNLTATETCTFIPFPLATQPVIPNNIVPEYYISHNTTVPGSAETVKCYQFPISLHLNTLSNANYTVTIQAQNGSGFGGAASVITLNILQFTGSGTNSPNPTVINSTPITITTTWNQYSLTSVFPPAAGIVLGNGADDAFYLQVQMPLDVACTINFTKPSLYLTTNVIPAIDFATYDQIDAIINSPRTGDIRTSLNNWYPYGWIPMNSGSIGNAASGATTRANSDIFPLYQLFWNAFNQYSAGTSSSGTNAVCPMYLGSTSVGYGPGISGSAIADFNANKFIVLTQTLGNIIIGTAPIPTLPSTSSQIVTASSSSGLLFTGSISPFATYIGEPIVFTNTGGALPTGILSTSVYYAYGVTNNTFYVATSFSNAIAGTLIAFTDAGSGTTTATILPLGSLSGEYSHAQLINELFNHTHALTGQTGTPSAIVQNGGASTFLTNAGGATVTGTITGYSSQVPFNVTQPSVAYNIYVKI